MTPVSQRSTVGQGPAELPRRATVESSRTTITTAASTTNGSTGAVDSQQPFGVTLRTSGVTVRTE